MPDEILPREVLLLVLFPLCSVKEYSVDRNTNNDVIFLEFCTIEDKLQSKSSDSKWNDNSRAQSRTIRSSAKSSRLINLPIISSWNMRMAMGF